MAALPQHTVKDIEAVLPEVQRGNCITVDEAVEGVRAELGRVAYQRRLLHCGNNGETPTGGIFDPIGRISALLERSPEPDSSCRKAYEALVDCYERKEQNERIR